MAGDLDRGEGTPRGSGVRVHVERCLDSSVCHFQATRSVGPLGVPHAAVAAGPFEGYTFEITTRDAAPERLTKRGGRAVRTSGNGHDGRGLATARPGGRGHGSDAVPSTLVEDGAKIEMAECEIESRGDLARTHQNRLDSSSIERHESHRTIARARYTTAGSNITGGEQANGTSEAPPGRVDVGVTGKTRRSAIRRALPQWQPVSRQPRGADLQRLF